MLYTQDYVDDAYVYGLVLPWVLALPVDGVQNVVDGRGQGAQEHDGILEKDTAKNGRKEREE